MNHLQVAKPILASSNISKTVEFYHNILGFSIVSWKNKQYATAHKNNICIRFWKRNSKIHTKNTSCYISLKAVKTLFEEFKKQCVKHANALLKDQL